MAASRFEIATALSKASTATPMVALADEGTLFKGGNEGIPKGVLQAPKLRLLTGPLVLAIPACGNRDDGYKVARMPPMGRHAALHPTTEHGLSDAAAAASLALKERLSDLLFRCSRQMTSALSKKQLDHMLQNG